MLPNFLSDLLLTVSANSRRLECASLLPPRRLDSGDNVDIKLPSHVALGLTAIPNMFERASAVEELGVGERDGFLRVVGQRLREGKW